MRREEEGKREGPEREQVAESLSEVGSQGRRQGEGGRESGDKGQSERQEAVPAEGAPGLG